MSMLQSSWGEGGGDYVHIYKFEKGFFCLMGGGGLLSYTLIIQELCSAETAKCIRETLKQVLL